MTILEMCLEKLFDKNEEIVRLVYCPGGHSLIWSRRVWRGTLGGTHDTAIPYEKLVNIEIPCQKWTKYRYRIHDR